MITRQTATERESSSKVEREGLSTEASHIGRLEGEGLHQIHQVAMDVLYNILSFWCGTMRLSFEPCSCRLWWLVIPRVMKAPVCIYAFHCLYRCKSVMIQSAHMICKKEYCGTINTSWFVTGAFLGNPPNIVKVPSPQDFKAWYSYPQSSLLTLLVPLPKDESTESRCHLKGTMASKVVT